MGSSIVCSHQLQLMVTGFTRRNRIYRNYPSSTSSIHQFFVLAVFGACHNYVSSSPFPIEEVHQLVTLTSSYERHEDCSRVRKSSSVLAEEENVQHICNQILETRAGTVEYVVESLRKNQACSRIKVTKTLVEELLEKYKDDWKSALGFFQWSGSHSGYEHSPYAYDKMVDILGKMKQLDKMWMLVDEMRNGGFIRLETIAKVMRRLAGAGRWEDAVKTFDDLGHLGLEKNSEAMNVLLDTLCKGNRVETARGVFLELKAHIPPNAHTFNILVHGWCKANRIDEAEWTVLEMKGYGVQPSVITYSTILQAYCNQFNLRAVYDLLDKMQAEGCPPNVVTYTTVMLSLSKSQEIEGAIQVAKMMKSSACKPDTLFYNALINILGRAGRLSEASHIFEVEMLEDEVFPDLCSYNTMISIFCHHSRGHDALKILDKLEHSQFKPDIQTYTPLLKLCFRRRDFSHNIRSLLSDIVEKHHLSIDYATYTLLIHGLCRAGQCEWACLLFEEMISRDMSPRHSTYRLLLDEAEQRNMFGIGERITNLMKQISSSCRRKADE